MMNKLTIIGAGISGLATGIKALEKGYDVTIYEKNQFYGGNYKISMEYGFANNYVLIGKAYSPIRRVVNSFIDFTDKDLEINKSRDYLYCYKNNGENLYIYNDIHKFENNLSSLSPFDKDKINYLIKAIGKFIEIDYSLIDKPGLFFKDKNSKAIEKLYSHYGKKSINDFLEEFKNKTIRNGLKNLIDPDNSLVLLIIIIGLYIKGDLIHLDDSSMLMNELYKKYIKLGGKIEYNSLITDIDKNKIIINKKDVIESDYIINCADIHAFYFDVLTKRYLNSKVKNYFEDMDATRISSNYVVCFKIDDVNNINMEYLDNAYYSFELKEKFRVGAKENTNFKLIYKKIKDNNYLVVSFKQNKMDYDFFTIINKNKEMNNKENDRIVKDVVELMINNNIVNNKEKLTNYKIITPINFNATFNTYYGETNGFILSPKMLGLKIDNCVTNHDNMLISNGTLYKPNWYYTCLIAALNCIGKLEK